jgi:hypothetical protein
LPISGTVAEEDPTTIKKYFWRRCRGGFFIIHQVPIHKSHLPALTLFSICLRFSSPPLHHFPLIFLSPPSPICRFIRLSFSFAIFLLDLFLFALFFCVVIMAQENTKLCDFSNTNNDDFISTQIAPPATSAESCEINAALLNLVMKEQFSGTPNEDAASHLNTFVELCDMQKKKYVDNDIAKLKLFPFCLRDHAKI